MKKLQTIKVLWPYKASIIASIVLLLIAHTATAQVAQSPTFAVGDTFEYVSGEIGSPYGTRCFKWAVKVANDNRYVVDCGIWQFEALGRKGNYATVSITKNGKRVFYYSKPFVNLQFPMQVGDKWSSRYTEVYSGNVAKISGFNPNWKIYTFYSKLGCEVLSYDNIDIALGKTMAYHIHCRSYPEPPAEKTVLPFDQHFWYSPKCKAVVKHKHMGLPVFNYEMSSCKLASQTDKK